MDVSGYQLARRYVPLVERVQEIADQAERLVQQRMREQMAPTHIVVAAQKHCPEVVQQAEQQTLGIHHPPVYRRPSVDYLGITVPTAQGALVVINAGSLRSRPKHWLDETVVHELAHAVQFARPGTREYALKGLRNNYGIERLNTLKAWKANRRVDQDEREAQSLEVLAREIR